MSEKKSRSEYMWKYKKEHYKVINIQFPIEYYEKLLCPAVKESGSTVARFVRDAIAFRISKEGCGNE